MSATTILQLRQNESRDVGQNGVWKSILDYPIQIEEGDEVVIKSVFLDTTVADDGIISVPSSIDLNMGCMMYLQNYGQDQTFLTNDRLRIYGPVPEINDDPDLDTTEISLGGDNNLWWLGQTYAPGPQTKLWDIESISWAPIKPINSSHLVKSMPIEFEFEGVIPSQPLIDGLVTIPNCRASDYLKFSPIAVGKICVGTDTAPNFTITTTPETYENHNIDSSSIKVNFKKHTGTHDAKHIVPQIFNVKFTLDAGNYTPTEIAKLITDKINNVELSGPVYLETSPAISQYPVDTPILKTILQNFNYISEVASGHNPSYETEQVFISSTLNELNPETDGRVFFKYDTTKMEEQKSAEGAAVYKNAEDRFVGTSQIALEFDTLANKLKWTILHFPIFNNLSGDDTVNTAVPCAAYNLVGMGTGLYKLEVGIATRYSGIAWTSLTAKDSLTGLKSNFWHDIGLTSTTIQATTKGMRCNYGGTATEDNSFTVTATDGKNITGALPGLDLPVVKNNLLYTTPIRPYGEQAVPVLDYVSTTFTTSIFAGRTFNTPQETEGYYLIEIGTNFKQAFLGGSATYMSGVQSIVNRYFTQNSYTSDQGAGSISYFHKGASQTLSEFNIRVLNPNFTVPLETQLGINNTIFIQVVKPKINQEPNPKK